MIAMALACQPDLVIADEPTTALDVMVQAQVLRLLKQLQDELGLSMLFITHDLSVLVEVSDRLAVMYAGRIVEEGPAAEVFRDPRHPYTTALAGAFPQIGDERYIQAPTGLDGDPPDPRDVPSGCTFHPRCAAGVRPLPERGSAAVPGGRGTAGGVPAGGAGADRRREAPGEPGRSRRSRPARRPDAAAAAGPRPPRPVRGTWPGARPGEGQRSRARSTA